MSDDAFDEFSRNICAYYGVKYTPPAVRQRPVAVTAENAAQFQATPKKRGRKPKVVLGGNVVAFRRPPRADWPTGWSAWLEMAYLKLRRAAEDAFGSVPPATHADRARMLPTLMKLQPAPVQQQAPSPPPELDMDPDVYSWFRGFLGKVNTRPIGGTAPTPQRAVKPPRKRKPKAAPEPPAEDDADARLQAFYDRINALPIGAMSDTGEDPKGAA